MKKVSIFLLLIAFEVVSLDRVNAADMSKVYYVCNCKDNCTCNSISKKPGKCKCGSELVEMHLLAIEKDTAILCRCGAKCTCDLNKADPNKCGCGKTVKRVNIKGKYICGCGDNCKCGTISDKPGKCSCGKKLKQVI